MQTIHIARNQRLIRLSRLQSATEPVGSVNDSIPLHPDDHHPDYSENKRKKDRKPQRDIPAGNPGGKPPDSEHQIDEYACPVQIMHEMIM